MAWDFSTDLEFQEKLDWVEQFCREQIEPLTLAFPAAGSPIGRPPAVDRLVDGLKDQVKEQGLWGIFLDKDNKNILRDEITTIDHALTRPWTVTKNYHREPNPVWHFNDCAENNHHVWIGKDNYMVSGDGYLMPVKKNQAPPDLKYFRQSGR